MPIKARILLVSTLLLTGALHAAPESGNGTSEKNTVAKAETPSATEHTEKPAGPSGENAPPPESTVNSTPPPPVREPAKPARVKARPTWPPPPELIS